MKSPLFIVGSPRSGTTFLVNVLDKHEDIYITNETRVFTFLSHTLHKISQERFLLWSHRDEFLQAYKRSFSSIVTEFYKDIGAEDYEVWGDKFPHYADKRSDPECLDLIDETFPNCKFIHLIRDGRDVVSSLAAKKWVDLSEATDVWERHVTHARDFGTRIGLNRYLEVRYEDLVAGGQAVLRTIEAFLGLRHSEIVQSFITAQQWERTPFSRPTSSTSELGATGTWRGRLTEAQQERVLDLLRHTLEEFGYADTPDVQPTGRSA